MKKRPYLVLLVIGIILIGIIYTLSYPSGSFYKEEFELATGEQLPNSAKLIEGYSEWGMSCAIFEISIDQWEEFTILLLNRANRDRSRPESFNPELLKSLGSDADIFALTTKRRFVFVGLNESSRQIFYEVWHN